MPSARICMHAVYMCIDERYPYLTFIFETEPRLVELPPVALRIKGRSYSRSSSPGLPRSQPVVQVVMPVACALVMMVAMSVHGAEICGVVLARCVPCTIS